MTVPSGFALTALCMLAAPVQATAADESDVPGGMAVDAQAPCTVGLSDGLPVHVFPEEGPGPMAQIEVFGDPAKGEVSPSAEKADGGRRCRCRRAHERPIGATGIEPPEPATEGSRDGGRPGPR